MKKIILLAFFFAGSLYTQAQSLDTILYILPDPVEVKLDIELNRLIDRSPDNVEFILEKKDVNKYRIRLYGPPYYSKKSNRYVIINTQKYPLIFDYDSKFGTTEPNSIGSIGKRDGQIMRGIFMSEDYSITFDGSGKILHESYGIYKRVKE